MPKNKYYQNFHGCCCWPMSSSWTVWCGCGSGCICGVCSCAWSWCELIRSFAWESISWCKLLADEALQLAICELVGLCMPLAQSILSLRSFNLWISYCNWWFRSVLRIVIPCYRTIWRYKFINKKGKIL
jgi:hypothetical protein